MNSSISINIYNENNENANDQNEKYVIKKQMKTITNINSISIIDFIAHETKKK